MDKPDILKGVGTEDQLPTVVTTGSSAAVTQTENTFSTLSPKYRAHCRNAFRIGGGNSSSTRKSHAPQAGIMSLVMKYTSCKVQHFSGLKQHYLTKVVCKYLCMQVTAKVGSKTGWDEPI
jgi:hypothetical protein